MMRYSLLCLKVWQALLRNIAVMIMMLTLYRMVMPIGTPFLKEKINN